MKIHRSAKICRHKKRGYIGTNQIHETESGYEDLGHYNPTLILIKIITCEKFNSTMIDTR